MGFVRQCVSSRQRRPSPPQKVLHFPSGRGRWQVNGEGPGGGGLAPAMFFSFWSCRLYNLTSATNEMLGIVWVPRRFDCARPH